jgi:NitT/TauT family transport system substrate-binding protein
VVTLSISVLRLLAWLLVVVTLSSCVFAPNEPPKRPVLLQLNGLAGGQHAGFMYARSLGYYADEGLDVTILEGRGSTETVNAVANGDSDFGYADAISSVRAAGSVTVVATIFQTSPLAILSIQSQPISRPADLHGKTIGATRGNVPAQLLDAVLEANNLTDVTVVDLSSVDLVPALRSGRVAAIVGSRDFEALQLIAQGENVVQLPFADAGAPIAGLSIVANPDVMHRDPQLVAGFVRASLHGWDAARKEPQAASRALVGQFLAGYEDEVDAQLRADLPLLCGPQNNVLGLPWGDGWSNTFQTATRAGLLLSTPAVDSVVDRDFIPPDAPRCPAA